MDSLDYPVRKRMRLASFDYNEDFRVFITICTKERRCMLARIVGTGVLDGPSKGDESGSRVELFRCGIIADQVICQMDSFYEHISVDEYVIMPNHIHLLVSFSSKSDSCVKGGPSGTPVPTEFSIQNSQLSKFVSTFKRFCNKEYGENFWQYRSYDHRIRDNDDLIKHINYIRSNPEKWKSDRLYTE